MLVVCGWLKDLEFGLLLISVLFTKFPLVVPKNREIFKYILVPSEEN
jgi:hypothetical protein